MDERIAELSREVKRYEAMFLAYRSALARTLDATCVNTSRCCARCARSSTCKGIFAHDALVGVLGRDVNLTEMF